MPENHWIWNEFKSTDIWVEIFWIQWEKVLKKRPSKMRIQIGFSCGPSSILHVQKMQQSVQGSPMKSDI